MLILCHCIVNVNARAPGIARWSNIVRPVWDIITKENLDFIQLPCLESAYLGLRRWWFVKEQYSNPLFKDLCRKISIGILEILKENNVKNVKLLGLGISPTCGYRETQSDPSWGGKPRDVNLKTNIVSGPGVLIETMDKILKEYGFSYEVYDLPPCMIYPDERTGIEKYPRSLEDSIKELSRFLEFEYRLLKLDEYNKCVGSDVRSGKILICPNEALWEKLKMVKRYIRDGYGLMLIPSCDSLTPEIEEVARIFALQVENHLDVGHQITLYEHSNHSYLFKKFLKILKDHNQLSRISRISL